MDDAFRAGIDCASDAALGAAGESSELDDALMHDLVRLYLGHCEKGYNTGLDDCRNDELRQVSRLRYMPAAETNKISIIQADRFQ